MQRQRLGLDDQTGQIAIARGLAGLPLEAGKLAFDFADHVVEPAHIGFGGAQAQLGFMAALMQSADAGGLFQDGAAGERLLADEEPDLALPHKGGGAGARTRHRQRRSARRAGARRGR